MPTVPQYNRQIETRGTPQVRLSDKTPQGFFGDPSAAVEAQATGQLVDKLGEQFVGLMAKAKKNAFDAKALEIDNRAAQLEADIQTEVSQMKGKDALGASEIVDKRWRDLESEIDGEIGFAGDAFRNSVGGSLAKRRLSLSKNIEAHIATESRNVQKHEMMGSLELAANNASLNSHDIDRVSLELGRVDEVSDAMARFEGLDKNGAKALRIENLSKVHKAVINAKMQGGFTKEAMDYLEANKEELTQEDRDQLAPAVKKSNDLKQADDLSKAASQKFSTVEAALKHFDSLDIDTGIKMQAIDLTKERFAIREAGLKKSKDRTFEALSSQVGDALKEKMAGGEGAVDAFTRIQNSKEYRFLDQSQKEALIAQYNDADRPNDEGVYSEFISLNQGQIAAMSWSDYNKNVRMHLSKEYRKKADDRYSQAKQGGLDANKIVSDPSSYLSDVKLYLSSIGVDPPAKLSESVDLSEKKRAQNMEANRRANTDYNAKLIRIQEKVEAFEVRKGAKASPEEIRSVVADQFLNYGPQRPAVSEPQAVNAVRPPPVPYAQIPPKFQEEARQRFLKATGREPSEVEISEFYTAASVQNRQWINEILGGRQPQQSVLGPRRPPLAPIEYRDVPASKRVQ